MASAKGKLVRFISGFALARAKVGSVRAIGDFRVLQLRWNGKPFAAGAKVQLLLPSDEVRTYTPIPSADGMTLVGWRHGDGPGTRWLDEVRAGDELPFVGPQRSLTLAPGPLVVVGDETSVAVAAAFAGERPGQVHAVIQTDAAAHVREAAASVGLTQLDVVARGDTTATIGAVAARVSGSSPARCAVTGGSELVARVRNALREAGIRDIATKTYWIPGRTGLD
jgi:NADPH-dependent ferric siderophore reductase